MRHLFILLLSLLPALTAAAYDPEDSRIHTVGYFVYDTEIGNDETTGTATLIDVRPGIELKGEVTIPDDINIYGTHYVVDKIGCIYPSPQFFEDDRAFKDFPEITRINIPATITDIGYMEFLGCTGINEFHVDAANKNFKDIDGVLFYRWEEGHNWRLFRMPPGRKKTVYTIPDDVFRIEQCAFADNKTLQKIVLSPNCLLTNPLWAWRNKSITEIDVSKNSMYESRDGVIFCTISSDNELTACPPALKLDSYEVPGDCTYILDGAFCNTSIPKIRIHDKVALNRYVFAGSDLEELECTAASLGNGNHDLCLMCPNLKKIHIVSEVYDKVNVGRFAFALCPSLTEVRFDSHKVELMTGAFYGCTALEDFPFTRIVSLEGDEHSGYGEGRQFKETGIKALIFPDLLQVVPPDCFNGCANLRAAHLNLGGGHTDIICEGAFGNCQSLEKINLGGIKWIGGNAFADTPLKSIVIPAHDDTQEEEELRIGLSFDFLPDTRCYLDMPDVIWTSADGSGNNSCATFIASTLQKKHQCVPPRWKRLYCPAGMREWYESKSDEDLHLGGPVTELFSLRYNESSPYLSVIPNPELHDILLVINEVSIDKVYALKTDETDWRVPGIPTPFGKEIKIGYSVDGVRMSTTYPADYNTSLPSMTAENDKIEGVYTISGTYVGNNTAELRPGIFIIRYTNGDSDKVIIMK